MREESYALKRLTNWVAVLYLLATVASMIGFSLLEQVTNGPAYLAGLYAHRAKVATGVLFHLVNDAAVVGLGVLLFTFLKSYRFSVATAVLSTRLLEAAILMVGKIGLLLLVPISEAYGKGGAAGAPYYQSLAALAQKGNAWAFELAMLTLGVGGFIFCTFLYTTRLVPRWIPVLGMIGYLILFTKSVIDILGYSTGSVLFLPVALFEFIFPVWLLVKGFDTSRLVDGASSP